MTLPWEPIPQAMQQHGGHYRRAICVAVPARSEAPAEAISARTVVPSPDLVPAIGESEKAGSL